MGIINLWKVLQPAIQVRSLTELSVTEGFDQNPDGVRGLRVGIDTSIWLVHSDHSTREGENAELRTLFFKCTRLISMPFLPLFIYDGPERPQIKRGKVRGKRENWLVAESKKLLDAFGFPWRVAPGEAEAELAYLNRIGLIDAVISDDGDTFVFGAETLIRNWSLTLTGNKANVLKNSAGKADGNHVALYRADNIQSHPEVSLTRGGLLLVAILQGGDYDQTGLPQCGVKIAHGLARCGFGDDLLEATKTSSEVGFNIFLTKWKDRLRQEMKTNSLGFLPKRCVALAKSIPEDFPDPEVIRLYTNPVTSESKGRTLQQLQFNWDKEPDIGELARFCELHFEWGYKEMILKRFRTVMWPPMILRLLRRATLAVDKHDQLPIAYDAESQPRTPKKKSQQRPYDFGTPSKLLAKHFSSLAVAPAEGCDRIAQSDIVVKIHSSRKHASTDGLLELRLEIAPMELARLAERSIQGTRAPPNTTSGYSDVEDGSNDSDGPPDNTNGFPDPSAHIRVWMPASMVALAHPSMVEEFEETQQKKKEKRAGKATTGKGKTSSTKGPTRSRDPKPITTEIYELDESLPTLQTNQASGSSKSTKSKDIKVKASKPQEPQPSVSQSRAIDNFFTAAKGAPKTKKTSTATHSQRKLANLFNDLDDMLDTFQSKNDVKTSAQRRPTRTKTQSRTEPANPPSDKDGPTTFRKGSNKSVVVSGVQDINEPGASNQHPNKRTPTKHKRMDSSSTDPDSSKLQKSPRKSKSRDSPRSPSSTPRKHANPSPSVPRPRLPALRTEVGPSNTTVIVISSDSESESGGESDSSFSFQSKISPPKGPLMTLAHRRRISPVSQNDIIDLT